MPAKKTLAVSGACYVSSIGWCARGQSGFSRQSVGVRSFPAKAFARTDPCDWPGRCSLGRRRPVLHVGASMLTALTQAVSDLRNRLKAKACSDQSSRGLELVELEDRILYSASPIVGELMVAVDGVSPEASAGDWSLFCATDEATDTVDSSLLETDGAGWRTGKSLQPESKTTNNSDRKSVV